MTRKHLFTIVCAIFIIGSALAHDEVKPLHSKAIELGAQGNSMGNFLDITSSKKYNSGAAESNSDKIHLMYVFGKNSGANLMIPGSRGIRRYSRPVFERISGWPHRQEGQMINLGNAKDVFDGVSSPTDIRRDYVKHRTTVYDKVGYKLTQEGPEDAINSLSEGDVLLAHLYENNTYAALRIQRIEPGAKGSITFDIKWGTIDDGDTSHEVKAAPGTGEQWEVGTVYADDKYWNEYLVGDAPLILSVPHGGAMNPVDVPDRDCPNAIRGTDMFTIELARELQNTFVKEHGVRPHVVVCNLSRRKVDQNRGIKAGACGNETMEGAWKEYHNYIDTAIALAGKQHERIFLMDIHAHGHKIQRLELGYIINGKELEEAYRDTRLAELAKQSAVTNIVPQDSAFLLKEHLFGENALGTLAENRGIRAIPSKQDPYPGEGERYLSRGYNILRYASDAYPNVYGVLVEFNRSVRNDENRPAFAKEFAKAALEYMKANNTL